MQVGGVSLHRRFEQAASGVGRGPERGKNARLGKGWIHKQKEPGKDCPAPRGLRSDY